MRFGLLSLALQLFLLSIALSAEPSYTPAAIDKLISSGSARKNGAGCATHQGLGCETFLWKESDRHYLYLFRRNGVSYGEFRDEILLDERFLSITEQHLVADSGEKDFLLKSKVLRFVRKHEQLIWKDEVCVGSTGIPWTVEVLK